MELQWVTESGSIEKYKIRTVDLLMRHRESNGTIWSRMLFIPHEFRGKALKVLVENYANSITGGRFYAGYLNNAPRLERVASQILLSEAASVDGLPAHDVVLEVADVDQLELDKGAPRSRAELVLVGAEFARPLGLTEETAYMMLGYVNDRADFARYHDAFRRFVSRIRVRGVRGTPYGTVDPASPGRSAVGALRLGVSRARAKEVCSLLYTWNEISADEASCEEAARPGFDLATRAVFCGDAVCALENSTEGAVSELAVKFKTARLEFSGRHEKLVEQKNLPDDCAGHADACLADGRASFSAENVSKSGERTLITLTGANGKPVLRIRRELPGEGAKVEAAPEAEVAAPAAAGEDPGGEPASPEAKGAAAPVPPSAPAPRRACTPGATQRCVGRGACSGGQACADDGSKWLACDCATGK